MTPTETPAVGGWRPIETAPCWDHVFAINAKGDIRRAFRHHPSARTDEFRLVGGSHVFKAVGWLPLDAKWLPASPESATPPQSEKLREALEALVGFYDKPKTGLDFALQNNIPVFEGMKAKHEHVEALWDAARQALSEG